MDQCGSCENWFDLETDDDLGVCSMFSGVYGEPSISERTCICVLYQLNNQADGVNK